MCPLDRVLTYKNLIYLLNLQFYCVNTSYPMDNCCITTTWLAGKLLETYVNSQMIVNFSLRSRLTSSGDL